jgi:hypothetical protein
MPNRKSQDTEMRPEYDFSRAVRANYAQRLAEGSNVVILDPDVAKVFKDSLSVNEALRTLSRIVRRESKRAGGRSLAPRSSG